MGKGTIQGNKAEPQIEYDEDGEVMSSTGGMGGGVHAFNGSIELTAARICNNQTFTGGGIFTQSTEVIDALKMTGGEITGNVAARMGAGICASLWYPAYPAAAAARAQDIPSPAACRPLSPHSRG